MGVSDPKIAERPTGKIADKGVAEARRPKSDSLAANPLTDTLPPGPLSIEEAAAKIREASASYAETKDAYRQKMLEILGAVRADPSMINKILFKIWAKDDRYDRHMERTGHDDAVGNLLAQIAILDRLYAPYGERIIGDRILEMSCGTGTVIKRLCDTLPRRRVGKLYIVGNDVSQDMKDIAREKLKELPCPVRFTCHDMRRWPPDPRMRLREGSVDTDLDSQSTHLIANEEALREEQEGSCRIGGEDRHIEEKANFTRNGFRLLRDNGVYIKIDEWPAVLSEPENMIDPIEEAIAYLFNRTFKPIERDQLRERVMKAIPEARFLAELKVPIWSSNGTTHMMYAHIFRKDLGKASRINEERLLPLGPEYEEMRMRAIRRVVEAFTEIDETVRNGFTPPQCCASRWIKFRPITEGPTWEYGEDTVLSSTKRYNLVVLPGVVNRMNPSELRMMLESAVDSLRIGGALLVIDEWKVTPGMAGTNGGHIRKSDFRDGIARQFGNKLIFAGALRVPIHPDYDSGMYGYLWRKIG